jgi:APA family basic amino acid/polyamine antiporter
MGMLVCTAMIVSLDSETLLTALAWMILGLLIYFGYSKNNSKLRA